MHFNTQLYKKVSVTLRINHQEVWEFVSADLRTDDTKLVRIARKLSKLEPKVQLRNFPSVEQIQDGSFEIFPPECKKFENSLKLPGVLFSISLLINNLKSLRIFSNFRGSFLNFSDNLHYLYPLKPNNMLISGMSIYIHKLLKLPGLDPNLWSLKTLAMSLFIVTLFFNKSSLSTNNTVLFRHIF